ncbi:MAG: hypothetical protein MZV70_67520 [Desulfobacterales bacterium]|nr:hypothetical protein [Desulfobacterales bacterium]
MRNPTMCTASVLRVKLVEELYFKGYPKIPPKWIDERLALAPKDGGKGLDAAAAR